jgi:exopolysaccharide biosynthesis polyprenyl glycosylphosphotransferase
MITTRARGLANLHALVTTLAIGALFWGYAAFILAFVPVVRLSPDVNRWPYFLGVLGGMVLSRRELFRLTNRYHVLEAGSALRLAGRQVALMALLIFTMMFATQDRSISRLFLGSFLLWAGLALAYLHTVLPRRLARLVFGRSHRLPTLFVARAGSAPRLADWVARKEPLGISPVGVLTDEPWPAPHAETAVPVLGGAADLRRVLAERPVGQVIYLDLPVDDADLRTAIDACQEHGCRLLMLNNRVERYTQALVPTIEDGHHFYTLQEEPLEDPLNRLLKRATDIAISLPVVLFVLPPLALLVAIGQRLQAPGPLLHVRPRLGMGGRSFRMAKFRSMRVAVANDQAEAEQATADDARIFPFGRWLRRRSLDEMPQFWHVLTGEMSLVGPRPYMPLLDEEFRRHARGYRTRHLVKPGITGLAQSLGYRGEILEQEMLHRRVYWDVHYITHWSLVLDVRIILRTFGQIFRPPPRAY